MHYLQRQVDLFVTSTCFDPKRVIIRKFIRNYMKYTCCAALPAEAPNKRKVPGMKQFKIQQ